MKKEVIKQKVADEFYWMLIYFSFLALFFCSLTTFQGLIIGGFSFSYLHYGYAIFQALILSKIIIIGQSLGLGERFKDKPLIIPAVYKAVIFSLFTLLFMIFEHFVTGYFKHKSFSELYEELADKALNVAFAKTLMVFLVYILLFSFLEIGNILGENKLFKLFFTAKGRKNFDLSGKS